MLFCVPFCSFRFCGGNLGYGDHGLLWNDLGSDLSVIDIDGHAIAAAAFPKVKSICGLLLPVVFLLLHLSYGCGTAVGIAGMIYRKLRKH